MGWRRRSFPRLGGINYPFLAALGLLIGITPLLAGCSAPDTPVAREATPVSSLRTNNLPTVDPSDALTYLDRAYIYLRDPVTYDQAIADATRAIELDRSLAEAYVARTRAYVEISHSTRTPDAVLASAEGGLSGASSAWTLPLDALLERAIADANMAIELDPSLTGAYFARAHIYLDTGRADEAVADYDHILAAGPDIYIEVMTYAHRSRAHLALGDLNEAIQDATRAIEQELDLAAALRVRPDLANWHGMGINSIVATAYTNRGMAYDRQGQLTTAVADFSIALDRDPEYVETYANRATAYVSMGLYSEALADANRALALNGRLAAAFNARALAYLGLGRMRDALADVDRAIEEDPQFAMAYSNRGYLQTGLGRYDEALADTTRAIELDPALASAYANRAEVYLRKGSYKASIADSTAALKLDPTLVGALMGRALAHLGAGDYTSALADSNLAILRNPGQLEALYIRGTALSILSEGTDGRDDLNRVIQESQNPRLVELARRSLGQSVP